MTDRQDETFTAGLVTALPIGLGYFPIAFAFGVAATGAGFSGWEAAALSVIIYAGASQFLALALLTSGAALPVAAFTLIAMNLRHVLYGPALMKAAGEGAGKRHAWAWAWGWGLACRSPGRCWREARAASQPCPPRRARCSRCGWRPPEAGRSPWRGTGGATWGLLP